MPEIGSSLSSTRTIYGGTAETGFCTCCVQCFLFQSALAFPTRTRDDSGMFCGGQFAVLDFAFFVKFTIWSISAYSTSMGLGQRLDSKGARYKEFMFTVEAAPDGKIYCL
jgi:hypothetical protein